MSRIEKALEKAAKLRESIVGRSKPEQERTGTVDVAQTTIPREHLILPSFDIGESIVDPSRVNRHIVCITEPDSPAAEQFKKLRARLLKSTSEDFLNTIMVTSAGIGEGKTMTALNLAVSLAQEIDYTVLLVDADLRKPSIARYLGIEAERGLGDYLAGTVELSDVLIKTGIGKLVILPGGNPPDNPAELLSSDRMRSLVAEMKQRYRDRYIIFDSSPVLVTADPLSLSNYVDGIVFVVQADETLPAEATQALSLLGGRNILGVVFNNVPDYLASKHHSYYNYRYGNGRKKQ